MGFSDDDDQRDVAIERPNRKKASSKATKAVVVLLLLVSVALMLVVTIGGWSRLSGAKAIDIAYVLIYLLIAFFVARWSRGVLPLAAALAIILGIFAGIAGPEWFNRNKSGFAPPLLDEGILGLVTLLVIPVQLLLIAFAMRGFQQNWNVEEEVPADGHGRDEGGSRRPVPAGA